VKSGIVIVTDSDSTTASRGFSPYKPAIDQLRRLTVAKGLTAFRIAAAKTGLAAIHHDDRGRIAFAA
jgi:hypothetical protein